MTERIYEDRIKRLEETLGTLIVWIAQAAISPLSQKEARELLNKLEGKEKK